MQRSIQLKQIKNKCLDFRNYEELFYYITFL